MSFSFWTDFLFAWQLKIIGDLDSSNKESKNWRKITWEHDKISVVDSFGWSEIKCLWFFMSLHGSNTTSECNAAIAPTNKRNAKKTPTFGCKQFYLLFLIIKWNFYRFRANQKQCFKWNINILHVHAFNTVYRTEQRT